MMKWLLIAFVAVLVGCDSPEATNIVGDADQQKLAEYEKALADAEQMAADDTDFEE